MDHEINRFAKTIEWWRIWERYFNSNIIFERIFFFFFFFNAIECKKGRTNKMQPISISKDPWVTKEKGKLIKWEGVEA